MYSVLLLLKPFNILKSTSFIQHVLLVEGKRKFQKCVRLTRTCMHRTPVMYMQVEQPVTINQHSDNNAVVMVIQRRSAKHRLLIQLLRCLFFYVFILHFHFSACHIPGIHNVIIVDTISRNNLYFLFLKSSSRRRSQNSYYTSQAGDHRVGQNSSCSRFPCHLPINR